MARHGRTFPIKAHEGMPRQGIGYVYNLVITKTITGLARIALITARTITGLARITASTPRTITGVARITATTTKTITGVARIQKAATQTETGKARITVSTPKTITGVSRITVAQPRTETGLARITATTQQTITGKASIASTGYTDYTRGHYAALPTDDAELTTAYTGDDIVNVTTYDGVYVLQLYTGEYSIHQFKNNAGALTAGSFTWKGKASRAPSVSTVYLQIYNRNTAAWETLDSNSAAAANTDFTLSAAVNDLTNYKNGSNIVACRVYQLGT